MIYAMADLHGEYDKYMAMLEKIGFSDGDTLYILGDVVDRGPHPVRILRDMMRRANVIPLLGNHDAMARMLLRRLMVEVTQENCETYMDMALMRQLLEWQMNGNRTTMAEFRALSLFDRLSVLAYLDSFRLYAQVNCGGRRFVLVHAGLGGFDPARPMESYTADELIFDRADASRIAFGDGTLVVCGHTPTPALHGKAEILREGDCLFIDCGAAFPGGRLSCLRLDDMAAFYV